MSNSIFGSSHKRPYFEGWYFKHQSPGHTLILIPAWHVDDKGGSYGSLQVILDDHVHRITFPSQECHIAKNRFHIRFGQTVFSEKGCRLHLDLTSTLIIRGHLYYGRWHRPVRSFMGPFRYLPLPCRHEVLSLSHHLRGQVLVGEDIWDFHDGTGYIEKDWGYEFPSHYLWIQGDNFMLTIVDLSTHRRRFLACSSLLRHEGKQYRLSTYQGARLNRHGSRRIDVTQGPYRLQITLPDKPTASVPLLAPKAGSMIRIIEEYPRYPLQCRLYRGKELIFDQESPYGSYELA